MWGIFTFSFGICVGLHQLCQVQSPPFPLFFVTSSPVDTLLSPGKTFTAMTNRQEVPGFVPFFSKSNTGCAA